MPKRSPHDDLRSADADQIRMMDEQVILTDYYDRPIGSGSKLDTHVMDNINAGMLHRAFSVFLFTPDGKLILQQRAATKITFPRIWANTCCSHPLSVPSETVEKDALGVKNAARRKLEHELGIPPGDVPLADFTWVTRVHYWGESGSDGLWGEHEIDWILLCKPARLPRIQINPNEVEQTRAFSQAELRAWIAAQPQSGEAVSPWFGVMERSGLLYRWWDAVLAGDVDRVLDRATIHRQHELEAIADRVPSKPLPLPFAACLAASGAPPPSPRGGRGRGGRRGGGLGVGPEAASASAFAPGAGSSSSSSSSAGGSGPFALLSRVFAWLLSAAADAAPDLMLIPVAAAFAAAAYLLSDLVTAGVRDGCGLGAPHLCFPPVTEAWQEALGLLAGVGFVYLCWPGRPPLWDDDEEAEQGQGAAPAAGRAGASEARAPTPPSPSPSPARRRAGSRVRKSAAL